MPYIDCIICNKPFYVKPSHQKLGYGKYCSIKCRSESQKKGQYIACAVCNKKSWKRPLELKRSKSGLHFCSKSCQTIWRNQYFSGPKHPNWKDGKNKDYRKIIRKSNRREECNMCGCKDTRVLVVHHIDKHRENNDPKNLIWLCMNCHYLIHKHSEKIN